MRRQGAHDHMRNGCATGTTTACMIVGQRLPIEQPHDVVYCVCLHGGGVLSHQSERDGCGALAVGRPRSTGSNVER